VSNNASFRNWLAALAVTTVAVIVCIAYIDRPVAEFFDVHLRGAPRVWINRALAPVDLIVVMALLFLLACGMRVVFGGALAPWTRTPLLCCWAAMLATAAETIFKQLFGRGWPDPTYVRDHVYGFHWLRGGPHWESFPSGTAAISFAVATVLWIAAPRWRAFAVAATSILCVAVVVINGHWVGDVIAGAFLGVTIGWITVAMQVPGQR
jgi:membrane-associated phospholipid phosphatase